MAARSLSPSTVAEKLCVSRVANPPSHLEEKYGMIDKVMQKIQQWSPKVVETERRGLINSTIAILCPAGLR